MLQLTSAPKKNLLIQPNVSMSSEDIVEYCTYYFTPTFHLYGLLTYEHVDVTSRSDCTWDDTRHYMWPHFHMILWI